MENPAGWNTTVKCIANALKEYNRDMEAGVIGYSLPFYIYLTLLTDGHLKEDGKEKVQGKW